MNSKDLFLFNSVKNIQFLKSFRPSSTPFNDLASPGLSNINVHSFLVQSHFSTSNTVYQKSTKEDDKKTEFVQEGKGIEDESIFDPIKIDRTMLEGEEEREIKSEREKEAESPKTPNGASKRKNNKSPKNSLKKSRFTIID